MTCILAGGDEFDVARRIYLLDKFTATTQASGVQTWAFRVCLGFFLLRGRATKKPSHGLIMGPLVYFF
jgi:hypothetical protein